MKKTAPSEFRDAFLAAIGELREKFSIYWQGRTTDYTSFMRSEVFPCVATKLNLSAYCSDYYTLDAVFYEEKDAKYFRENTMYARYIAVAIEHENITATSYVEMNKLQIVNTPLKVLITYARPGRETEQLLQTYNDIVGWADCFGDIASLRRQLVIFGEPDALKNWRFFVYESAGFAPL